MNPQSTAVHINQQNQITKNCDRSKGDFTMALLWKNVAGYDELYLVSNEGDVYSLPRIVSNGKGDYLREGRILKHGLRGRNNLKYAFVILSDGKNKPKHFSVHRLVAEAFVDNPFWYDTVNHIDHDTLNNRADNLEWCTQQYNNEYGHNKPIRQYETSGEFVAEYKNISYASLMTGISRTAINNALTGYSKTSGGYVWKYAID